MKASLQLQDAAAQHDWAVGTAAVEGWDWTGQDLGPEFVAAAFPLMSVRVSGRGR